MTNEELYKYTKVDLFLKIDCKDLAFDAVKSAKNTQYYQKEYFRSVIDSIKIK